MVNNPEENPEVAQHTNPQTMYTQPILKTIDNTTYYYGPQTTPPPPNTSPKTHILPVIDH